MTKLQQINKKVSVLPKFQEAKEAINKALIEREPEVDMVLLSLVCQENPLLIGAPGTAKSLLLDSIGRWMDASVFPYLFTKFTDPMEIFGPINVPELKAGRYERVVEGYMPTASLIFADEVFKGSSAINNTCLKIMNERTFKFGQQELDCPCLMFMGASNEVPTDKEELGAMWDRFLLRKKVNAVSTVNGVEDLLFRDNCTPEFEDTITEEEVKQAYKEAKKIMFSDEAKEALLEILKPNGLLESEGIIIGDRRKRKSVMVCKAAAWLDGSLQVLPDHLECLENVLWENYEGDEREKASKVICKVANPTKTTLTGLVSQAQSVYKMAKDNWQNIQVMSQQKDKLEELIDKIKVIQDIPFKRVALDRVLSYKKEILFVLGGIKA